MNATTGKIEINRDYYEYAARLRENLMNGMQPLDNRLTDQILSDYYKAAALLKTGKAVLV